MKKLLKIVGFFLTFILNITIFLNLYIIYNQVLLFNNYPTLFGFGQMVITDNNSELHEENDFLITYKQDIYEEGDEIVYESTSHEILTSIVYKTGEFGCYVSDNTEVIVLTSLIKGKVLYNTKNIGIFILWLNSSLGTIVLLIIAVLIIEIPKFWDIIKRKIEKR